MQRASVRGPKLTEMIDGEPLKYFNSYDIKIFNFKFYPRNKYYIYRAVESFEVTFEETTRKRLAKRQDSKMYCASYKKILHGDSPLDDCL